MGGRKTDKRTGVKHHDEDAMHARHVPIHKRGEIAVFNAGKYFAGDGNRKSQIEEMEEEVQDEDADAEVGGDLPLSPLPEFYTASKLERPAHYRQKNQWQRGDKAHGHSAGSPAGIPTTLTSGRADAQRQAVVPRVGLPLRRISDGQDSLPSPPSMASSGNDQLAYDERARGPSAKIASSHSEPTAMQSKSSSTKPSQPFSPSARLTSFLAKFKLSSSESKSKPSSQYSSAAPPTSTKSPKSFSPNATALPANGKLLTSPRGRFLRALSSSSSFTHPLLKPIAHMHHRSSAAANSTPVSPAGSDPYSPITPPITHSASSTPTSNSRKNPRSRSRSHVSHLESTSPSLKPSLPTTDWRRDLDNSSRHSLSTHLPLLRRKLKAYLMPEKLPRQHHAETQNQLRSKQKVANIVNVSTGAHADQDRQWRSDKVGASISVSSKPQVATLVSEACEDNRQHRAYMENAASTPTWAAHTKAQGDRHKPHHNTMRSPGRPGVELATTKDARRRGDWRKHAEDDLEDDIKVAERLLRVVREHQSSETYTSSYKGTSNYKQQNNGYGGGAKGQGSEMVNAGSSSRKSRRSFVSPSSSPAAGHYYSKQAAKEEFACPYDSDSSSDLFEIESLQAFSHVSGLYNRPHELPVYEANPLKSPLHLK